MEINTNEVQHCIVNVHYIADAEQIMNKRAEVIKAFRKAPVKGFRDGKASELAITQTYGQQIDDALKRALAEDAYHNTLFEKKLRVHGAPKFNSMLLEGGKFTCEFEVHTKPDFVLPDLKAMEVVKPHQKFSENEVAEKMLQDLRVKLGEVSPFTDTDFVQDGDNVIVDYDVFENGVKLDKLCIQGEMITMGSSGVAGFDSNLLGMKTGETREFDFTTPADGLPSISGKNLHFKLTLTTGAKTMPAALDDNLAQQLGEKTFVELREKVQKTALANLDQHTKQLMNAAIVKKLASSLEIDIPHWMELSEAQYLAHQSKLEWDVLEDQDKEKLLGMAKENSKVALILDKVREEEPDAQMTDQEVFNIIKQNLMNTKTDANLDEVIDQMNKSGQLQILFARIKDEYTLDFISKQVKVIE